MKKLLKYSNVTVSTRMLKAVPVLGRTKSVCPVCLNVLPARYISRDGTVLLSKSCPEHGVFETPVWDTAAGFNDWRRHQNPAQAPSNPARKAERGCPYDCGLCENHIQATCCVLLEVTSRCDLYCPVCFASSQADDCGDPSFEMIAGWYDMLLERGGPFNIQLSGGEPTMRDDLPEVIRLGRDKGFDFFQLNTNGLRIAREPEYLHRLVQAGLNTVFLQFDSPSGEHCSSLRGRDITAEKLRAVSNCSGEGLGVVLVPTVRRGVNDSALGEILSFAAEHMPTVRGVHFQPMSFFGRYEGSPSPGDRLTISGLLRLIEEQTNGQLKASDFLPGGAEHPMCSFHADYTVYGNNWTLQKSPGNTGCCAAKSVTSDAARRAVARKWTASKIPAQPSIDGGGMYNFDSLDRFLADRVEHTLAISGMAFQDAWNLDLDRLSRCYINVVSPQGELIPFCAYNLTAMDGTALYRKNSEQT